MRERESMEIEGTTRWMRSEKGANCICCEGLHVFATYIEADPGTDKRYLVQGRGSTTLDTSTFIHDAVASVPEGQRIRITIEAVD